MHRPPKREIRIDYPKVGIPYADPNGGFGVVYVELKPGQRRDNHRERAEDHRDS